MLSADGGPAPGRIYSAGMKGAASPERRRHRRVPREIEAKITALGELLSEPCQVHNQSAGGAVIRSKRPITVGSIVRLDILDPGSGAGRRQMARVAWARSIPSGIEAGLRYVEWKEVGKERRRHPRRDLGVFIQYRVVSKGAAMPDFVPAMLQTISPGGLSFSTGQAALIGAIVQIKLPETPLGPARTLRAKVLRVNSIGGRDRWVVAARVLL
jgi:hypothetical protein